MQDIEKKNIVAVQAIRNMIMGSTLMATTSILLCAGLGAVISSTYSVKKPIRDSVFGANGEYVVALKYAILLAIFLFSFLSHALSIRFLNQINVLIMTPQEAMSLVTPQFLTHLLEKANVLNIVGNRLFYIGLPLLLWIFGPLMAFLCCVATVPVLYKLDFVAANGKVNAGVDRTEPPV